MADNPASNPGLRESQIENDSPIHYLLIAMIVGTHTATAALAPGRATVDDFVDLECPPPHRVSAEALAHRLIRSEENPGHLIFEVRALNDLVDSRDRGINRAKFSITVSGQILSVDDL